MEIKGQFFSLRFGPSDFGVLKKLIDTAINSGINTICIELEKAFRFESHPEVSAPWAIEKEVFRDLAAYLRAKQVEFIPLLPLFSHADYILNTHPEFRELNSPVYCVHAPGLYEFLFELTDEIIEVFNPNYFHIGHDEALSAYDPRKRLSIFNCSKCGEKEKPYEIFASDINKFHKYFFSRNIKTMMWGDSMLAPDDFKDASFSQSGCYGGMPDNLAGAVDLLPKDIVMCDWHYEPAREFPTIKYLQEKGFETIGCPKYEINSLRFTDYAYMNKTPRFKGMMGTSWCLINKDNFRALNDIIRKNAFIFSHPGKIPPGRNMYGKIKDICARRTPVMDTNEFHGVYDFRIDGNGIYHSCGWRDLVYIEWPSLSDPLVPPRYPSSLNIKAFRYGYIDYNFCSGKNKIFNDASLKVWMKCPGRNSISIKTEKSEDYSCVCENSDLSGVKIDISPFVYGCNSFNLRFEAENGGNKLEVFLRRFEIKIRMAADKTINKKTDNTAIKKE